MFVSGCPVSRHGLRKKTLIEKKKKKKRSCSEFEAGEIAMWTDTFDDSCLNFDPSQLELF